MKEAQIIPSTTIRVKFDGCEPRTIQLEDYVKAKTKALQEFGYPKLTEDEVREQLEKVIHNGTLDVIGQFIKGDIVL